MEWNMKGFLLSTATLLSMLEASSVAWAQQQGGPGYGPYMMWNGGSWMFFGPPMPTERPSFTTSSSGRRGPDLGDQRAMKH